MEINLKSFGLSKLCAVIISVAAISLGSNSLAAPGPGGDLDIEPGATFEDNNTHLFYNFGLRATESAAAAGLGDAVMEVIGPGASACTVHGSSAQVDWTDVGNEGGVAPGFECGRSYGESVKIDDCRATIQAHGFSHSDHPLINYLGPTTLDIDFRKKSANSGDIDITIHTAAGKIMLKGKISGPILMSTCP
jgi:hypothetical protein